MSGRYVFCDDGSALKDSLGMIGGKARNLQRLGPHLAVPGYYVVTVAAFRAALDAQRPAGRADELLHRLARSEGDAAGQAAGELCELIRRLEWPREIEAAIRKTHAERFGNEIAVAVRSSAVGEDSPQHSFAGMHDSVLGIRDVDGVLGAIRQVWSSYFSHRALTYRRRHNLPLDDLGLAVLVQEMINARQSGVLFTCDPTSGDRRELLIEAVLGSGEKLVQGNVNAETYRVRKAEHSYSGDDAVRSTLSDPPLRGAHVSPDGATAPRVLTESQVRQAVQTGVVLERVFGCPQDVEFCFDQAGEFFVLQSRPVTTLASVAPASGRHLIWDNSNIIESYSGVTTPLTFSFIRQAYAIVYKCFAEVMGISPQVVQLHRGTFENMLGLFRGRVYYNLKNWYRLVRLFPGYQYNSRFMEAMMGLKEPLVLEDEAPQTGALRRWFVELPSLIILFARIAWKFLRIQTIVGRFERHFESHYARWRKIDFRSQQPHELLTLYRKMQDALLWNWKAPIINDFYVMVFYGVLKKLCLQWCGDQTGALQNGLLCGSGDLASAEPVRLVLQLTRVASENSQLRELILREPLLSLPERVASDQRFEQFQTLLERYLDEYGLRCENELKLEAVSYRDRPDRVYQMVRDYLVLGDTDALDEGLQRDREQSRRREAEHAAFAASAKSSSWLPRRWIFRWVLDGARRGIRNRENLRFARTKVYGIARAMFRAVGEQLAAVGALARSEDVFYLTTDEVWDYVQGTAVSADLRGLADARRREYDAYRNGDIPPPDDRFETYGMAYAGNAFRRRSDHPPGSCSHVLGGVGCCPGIVEGVVQVLQEATHVGSFSGDILVAARTDPGWAPLFPAFRGLLIERGSVLSHSAIVARELGIPTVVGIRGLTDRLQTGKRVRMDGLRGTVEMLTADDDSSESVHAGAATPDADRQ